MNIYIPEFILGVVSVLVVELILLVIFMIRHNARKKSKESRE